MNDRGSGSVLGIAILAAVICVTASLVPLIGGLQLRARLAGSADAAALAAADVASGALPGIPCEEAARVTTANGASMVRCGVDAGVATVTVRGGIAGFTAEAAATAGPPGSSPK